MLKSKTKTRKKPTPAPAFVVRRSPVHGTGLFAKRAIKKGEKIIEYIGEHISHEEADRRHADKADDDNHTFLFTIDKKTVIDAGVGGNDARLINHSCDPNCEVILTDGRPLVEAIRAIRVGEELAYDYNLTRAPDDTADVDRVFACRCGAATCRGTMLEPPKKPKKPAPKPKASARSRASANAKRTARKRTKAA